MVSGCWPRHCVNIKENVLKNFVEIIDVDCLRNLCGIVRLNENEPEA
jgi:hypothetical protein